MGIGKRRCLLDVGYLFRCDGDKLSSSAALSWGEAGGGPIDDDAAAAAVGFS